MTSDVGSLLEALNAAGPGAAPRDLVTIGQAASILGCSLRTARRLQAAGKMPTRVRIIYALKYDRADIEELRDALTAKVIRKSKRHDRA